jgi:large subunit ribosomal protein L10
LILYDIPCLRFRGQGFCISTVSDFKEVKQEMPSASVLEQKKQIVAQVADRISKSIAGVVVEYKGITVADDTAMRKELREAGVEYTVVKNTLLGLAIKDTSLESMSGVLEGTTAIATSNDDYVAAARILNKYADKIESFNLKSGYLDGEVISLEKLKELATLPSREVLLSMVANVFSAPIASFARAVQAIADKNGEGAEAPAEA